jgi:hypothetical protein
MKREWLWLLLIPTGAIMVAIGIPLVLIGMLIGSRVLAMVAGPVNIWNTTRHLPPMADFTGYYQLTDRSWKESEELGAPVSRKSGFRLRADHRMEVFDLPDFGSSGEPNFCSYNGTGNWSSYEDGDEVMLSLNIKVTTPAPPGNRPSCGPISLNGFTLLGHSAPYRFWCDIGDPDSEQGLTYARQ